MSDPVTTLRACARAALPADERLLLAVSGGSDSVALLAAARAAPELAGRIAVVHVHHGLRPAADADAGHVRALATACGLACRVVEARPAPGDSGRSETAARRRRLAALEAAARDAGAGAVLLAHHRDDEDETVLLRLLRGHRGSRSLAGVPTLRAWPGGVRLVRPFLWGAARPGRRELAALREAAGLRHVEDETNRDERVPRNAVRAALASGGPELAARVTAARAAARAALGRAVAEAASALMTGLRPEGLGAALDRDALTAGAGAVGAPGGRAADERFAETLRLLGACLRLPRRVDTRGAVLAELRQRLARDGGRLRLPAEPAPLELELGAAHVHLPHDALAQPDAVACVLAGLARGPLYL